MPAAAHGGPGCPDRVPSPPTLCDRGGMTMERGKLGRSSGGRAERLSRCGSGPLADPARPVPLSLPAGVPCPVDVRLARLGGFDRDAWAAALDVGERERAARFVPARDRDRFILGRGLLRSMLSEATGRPADNFRFVADAAGKPVLVDRPDLAFNVSHSGDAALVAVGRARSIGIDIEEHRTDFDPLALGERVFAPAEMDAIRAVPAADRTAAFFRQWVLKEALLKGLGTGFSIEPRSIDIVTTDGTSAAYRCQAGTTRHLVEWRLVDLPAPPGYSAALAVCP